MIERRPFGDLGGADHGWLKAKHHFSFARYYDPERLGHGALRVWNDDEIAPNTGFPPHPHEDMEIITYVRQGAITHEDSLGHKGRTEAGDVQVMSAGSGIRHAEFNREPVPTTLFQIWIEPEGSGGEPSWGAKPFPKSDRSGRFVPLASGFAGDGDALPIRAPARVLGATLKAGDVAEYARIGALIGSASPSRRSRWPADKTAGSVRLGKRLGAPGRLAAAPARLDPDLEERGRHRLAVVLGVADAQPALITCTSPASVRPLLPRLSSWVIAPWRT